MLLKPLKEKILRSASRRYRALVRRFTEDLGHKVLRTRKITFWLVVCEWKVIL
jgi:hypothetical protein